MKGLQERGLEVRLMAVENADPSGPQADYPLKHFVIPIFEPLIRANGFSFARTDRALIREAVRWADVIHLEEAFPLQVAVYKAARAEGKPCVSTFHVFPHNILANLGFGKRSLLAPLLIGCANKFVYNRCTDIQCPSLAVRDYLLASGTRARLHVFSNGIEIPAEPQPVKAVNPGDVIDILCVGRLSREKSPETLLNAMRFSKYAGRIRLHFAGKGPKEKKYRKMADRLMKAGVLKQAPVFGFYSSDELATLAAHAYLYIHCAWVEVEGLSCLEAMREGLVPVIGEGPLIATSAFALCPESRYPERDSRALAQRIDWWIEHPERRNEASREYAAAARRYNLEDSIGQLVQIYQRALDHQ